MAQQVSIPGKENRCYFPGHFPSHFCYVQLVLLVLLFAPRSAKYGRNQVKPSVVVTYPKRKPPTPDKNSFKKAWTKYRRVSASLSKKKQRRKKNRKKSSVHVLLIVDQTLISSGFSDFNKYWRKANKPPKMPKMFRVLCLHRIITVACVFWKKIHPWKNKIVLYFKAQIGKNSKMKTTHLSSTFGYEVFFRYWLLNRPTGGSLAPLGNTPPPLASLANTAHRSLAHPHHRSLRSPTPPPQPL